MGRRDPVEPPDGTLELAERRAKNRDRRFLCPDSTLPSMFAVSSEGQRAAVEQLAKWSPEFVAGNITEEWAVSYGVRDEWLARRAEAK